jgi:hypothetical protein
MAIGRGGSETAVVSGREMKGTVSDPMDRVGRADFADLADRVAE